MKKIDILSNMKTLRSAFIAFIMLFGLAPSTTFAQTTINKSVAANSDDAEEAGSDATGSYYLGHMDLSSTDIELTTDNDEGGGYSGGTQTIGLRFNGITVPPGAIITDAYLTFRAIAADAPNSNSSVTNLTIKGQLIANAPTFTTTDYNISSRTLTTASASWVPTSWTTNSNYNSPSIVSVIQEIVNQGTWASGNAVAIIITGTGHRSSPSYNGDAANAARLVITYITSTTTKTWTGNVSTDWATSGNWQPASVPVTGDTVNIPTSPSGGRFPILSGPSSNQVRINVLDIQSGATFTQTGSYFILHKDLIIRSGGTFNQLSGNLLLYNDWINKGTFTSVAGWVTLGNQTSLSDFATGVNEFYDLSISTGETPKFDNFPSSLIKIKGGLYNYGNYNVSSAATFLFNGTGTQPIYNQTAAGNATLGNFVIDKSAGSVILVTKLLEISGNATVTNGTFNIDTCSFQRTAPGGALVLSNSSTLKIGGTKGMPTSFATRTFSPSSTVEYSGTNQIISSENYGNLTLSGSGTKTFAEGTTSIFGNFSVTIPPPPYAPIGNYSKNYNPNYQTASVLGDITINTTTNSSNIDYNGNGNQTVLAIDYYNLTLSNSGTKYFAAGTVGIGGDLNVTGSALVDAVTDNDTVKYFGTNKTVRYGFVNKNLKIDDNTSFTAGANIPVNNTLVISSGATLDMDGYVLTTDSVIINDGTLISTNPAGIMSFYSKNNGNLNELTSWANSGYDGTTTPRLPGTINNDVLIIGNGKTITLTSNVSNLGTIRVESTGALSTGSYILSGKGKFDLRSGGTLKIGSADGISSSSASGNIQTAIRSFSSAANYEYNGTAAQSTGNGLPSVVNTLVMNNSNGVLLSNNTKLNGNLSLLQGRLALADKNLTLGSTSSIVGTPSSSNMVVATGSGQLRKEFLGIGSFTFPVGDNDGTAEYSPVTLDFTSGTFASAYAGVRLVNAKHPQNTSTSNYLNRYWTVASSGITAFSCNVTFTYVDADVQPGGTENSIYGAQYEGSWSLLNPVNSAINQISHTVSSFSDFTGGESSALPVELVSFNASVKQNSVYLSWKTATEVNNYGFEVERSADAENWIKIGFVNGYGNSNSLKEYAFEDSKLSSAAYYYRLKQMDNDGSFSYSNVVNVTVDYSPNSFALSQNYPNPFNPSTKIRYSIPSANSSEARNLVTLKVYDILGTEVATLVNEAQSAGFYEMEFSGSQLTSGVYIYKIQIYPANGGAEGFSETRKMLLTK